MKKMPNESQCFKKRSYMSMEHAYRMKEKILKERGVQLRMYKCDYCYCYHLTKNV